MTQCRLFNKGGVRWVENCKIAIEQITNKFAYDMMKYYSRMGYDVPCKILELIVSNEMSSQLLRSTTAKLERVLISRQDVGRTKDVGRKF